MAEKKEREKFKPIQEEFIGDGISDMSKGKEEGSSQSPSQKSKQSPYEERSLENIRKEARERGINGYATMAKAELVNALAGRQQPDAQKVNKGQENEKNKL